MITNVKKKKWVRKIMVASMSILILFIVGLFGIYFWLSSKWTDFYSEAEMRVRAAEIAKTAPLPESFYYAYDKIYAKQRNRLLSTMSLEAVAYLLTMQANKQQNCRPCNCIGSTYFFETKVPINYHSWTSYIEAFGLEKFASEGKCLDFNYRKYGIDSIAKKIFSKPLNELTVEENIALIFRM